MKPYIALAALAALSLPGAAKHAKHTGGQFTVIRIGPAR
jgi:hypothetical protein